MTPEPEIQALFQALQALEGLWDWDLSDNHIYFSPRWKSQAGYENGEMEGTADAWYRIIDPADQNSLRTQIAAHLEGLSNRLDVEYRLTHRDGSTRWMHCRGLAQRDSQGRPHRLSGFQIDITERKLAERHILKDAFRDSLTGLPNRALFLDRIDRVLQHHKRYPLEHFSVMSIELRPMLPGGATAHWEALEPVLALASQNLEKGLRACDTLGRIGGSEFAVLLGRVRDPQDAEKVLERLRLAAAHSYQLDGQEVYVSVDAGTVEGNPEFPDAPSILESARTSRLTKSTGTVSLPSRRMSSELDPESKKKLIARLEEAVQREDFRVQYLPWVSLEDGKLAGFEALVRWKRVLDEQVIAPGEFLKVAEESGLLKAIEAQVLSVACRKTQDWNKHFKPNPPLLLSVNIGGPHLVSAQLAEAVRKALEISGFLAPSLILEASEIDLKLHGAKVSGPMAALAKSGVRWAVDNFGMDDGFLSTLQRLPVSFLKLDR